jgi:hypothetical protein
MKWSLLVLVVLSTWNCSAASEAKIVKVLPHLLDAKGRNSLYPSLYERDAYQVHLREHPSEISGMRFDLQWKSGGRHQPLKLKIEVRGSKLDVGKIVTLETEVQPSRMFSKWSSLTVDKQKHQEIGEVTAWRATLWDGNEQIAEQESFLW